MPATGTVDLERLSDAPPTLARMARGLRDRLTGSQLDRLAAVVEQIPPGSADPRDVPAQCWDWFNDRFLPAVLDPAGISRVGRGFTDMRDLAAASWAGVKRQRATSWLDAWDAGANAIWTSGSSVVWQELGGQRAGATPGWDAAAHGVRILAAEMPAARFDELVLRLQTSVVDLFTDLVNGTR